MTNDVRHDPSLLSPSENDQDETLRKCLIEPPSAMLEAAGWLQKAVVCHLSGDHEGAAEAFIAADVPECGRWADSLWGRGGPWSRPHLPGEPATTPGIGPRQASRALEDAVAARDGHWCRFCGIGVVRREKRDAIRAGYPDAVRWGSKNDQMHMGLMAMTGCFDHVMPYSRGGATNIDNIVLCCWPCNNGRASLTLKEVGLADPLQRKPAPRAGWEAWDGLESFLSL